MVHIAARGPVPWVLSSGTAPHTAQDASSLPGRGCFYHPDFAVSWAVPGLRLHLFKHKHFCEPPSSLLPPYLPQPGRGLSSAVPQQPQDSNPVCCNPSINWFPSPLTSSTRTGTYGIGYKVGPGIQ